MWRDSWGGLLCISFFCFTFMYDTEELITGKLQNVIQVLKSRLGGVAKQDKNISRLRDGHSFVIV